MFVVGAPCGRCEVPLSEENTTLGGWTVGAPKARICDSCTEDDHFQGRVFDVLYRGRKKVLAENETRENRVKFFRVVKKIADAYLMGVSE